MKRKKYAIVALAGMISMGVSISCSDKFLDLPPQAAYSETSLANAKGLEGILVTAYSTLDGTGNWYSGGMNALWGSMISGDSYKGSEPADQVDVNPVERYEVLPSNPTVNAKWDGCYDGIGQANNVLKALKNVTTLPEADRIRIEAEARFLRGYHHFEAKKVFGNPPYIDETIVADFRVPNDTDIWPAIEADLKFAYESLPGTQSQVGRVNKWAAGAFLAKALLYQKKYAEAKVIFDAVISQGVTSNGLKYDLLPKYGDNFKTTTENGAESVFAIQSTFNDGSQTNGNYDGTLFYPHGSGDKPGGCCGFFQPTQNLVNSYKTSATGLPLPDSFNSSDVTSDETKLSADAFVPFAGTLDPRLDWSVGRRGIPYYDWGIHPGRDWIRLVTNGGPFSPKKNTYYKEDIGKNADKVGWGFANNGLNIVLMRFADVLLMAAECEVEVGSLETARTYVNRVRRRAANPDGMVKKLLDDADPTKGFSTLPAANYVISEYTTPFAGKAEAETAVRFERKLELAMEGHRFFDLVRWGIADQAIATYLAVEATKRPHLAGAVFVKGKNEYMPIPESAILQSFKDGTATLRQNPGYPQ